NSYYHEYYSAANFALEGYRDLISASEYMGAENLRREKTLNSFFMNAEYDYLSKYYLSGSIRRDGASTFGANNRWGTFWSIGGKWRLSEEKFMESAKNYLSNFSLRASYGSVGNSDTEDWYASRGFYSFGFNYNNQPGMRPTSVENKDLGWETTYKFDVGFDALLFNRINITFDYFDQRTKDLLFPVPVSMTTGLSTYMKNIGEMKNSGIELGVNANVFKNSDWNITMYANLTSARNKVTKTPNGEDVVPNSVTLTQVNRSNYAIIREGYSFYSFYLREWAGVDSATGKPLWYKEDGTTTSNYNEADRRMVGNADPNIYGGFGFNVSFKGFDLGADFTYSQGNKVYGDGLRFDLQVGNDKYGNVTQYVYKNAWTPENTNTNVPRFVYGDNSGANNHSTRFLMDGSYLRLQTLTLGYNLPKPLLSKIYLSNIRLYASVDNLFTITADDYLGFDPAVTNRGGGQAWVYPTSRTFTFGLNIGF
ncbi:MAG: SusC/RagA family TonB-linked outer membrane protein, partial [Prevotella sp.]|nr:SusC/RagA family TonB-linked outer membrane protein [Prevotella sp.]